MKSLSPFLPHSTVAISNGDVLLFDIMRAELKISIDEICRQQALM